jgi:hypothetical protein
VTPAPVSRSPSVERYSKRSVPEALATGVYTRNPPSSSCRSPRAGREKPVTQGRSPSGSASLPAGSNTSGVSSSAVKTSAVATGARLFAGSRVSRRTPADETTGTSRMSGPTTPPPGTRKPPSVAPTESSAKLSPSAGRADPTGTMAGRPPSVARPVIAMGLARCVSPEPIGSATTSRPDPACPSFQRRRGCRSRGPAYRRCSSRASWRSPARSRVAAPYPSRCPSTRAADSVRTIPAGPHPRHRGPHRPRSA